MPKTEIMPVKRGVRPPRETTDIERSLNRLFEEFFTGGSALPRALRGGNGESMIVPEFDLAETEEELIVSACLPGVEKRDIHLEVTENQLIIRGERKGATEEKGRAWLRREQSYGAFYRAMELPSKIDPQKVKAMDKNGILEIHLPKVERTKARHVNVE
ncbi:MAG: Hsp20/alpha crystallin family protein [Elusimicrobia bacterium]|nr:Hsp20/alpha crystallin family protein [Elusimicrobiota bacterium]